MGNEDFSIILNADALNMGDERHERRDAAENRQRVLAAARQLFEERGVAAVHMADIADAAGVGKGTLYRRFANKAELCLALLHDQLVEHQDAMLRRLQEMNAQNLPYVERTKVFLVEVVAFTERHVPLLCEAQQGGQIGGLEGDAPFFVWQHMTVQGLLQGALNRGEIRPDLDLPFTVDLLLAPITAAYFRYLRYQRSFSIERIGDALCDVVDRLK